ncbi:MAG: phosphatidate cytidylyltransferase [Clostridia bacterium]|nr:phosphatidate cytidylyltransferase [Clostridia bacterium]
MKTRIITAIVAILIFVPVLIFSDTVVFPIACGVLAVVAAWEMLSCVGMRKNAGAVLLSLVATAAAMVGAGYLSRIGKTDRFEQLLLTFTYVYLFLMLTLSVFSKGRLKVSRALTAAGMIFFIVFGFSSVVLLREAPHGGYLYLLIFLSAWVTDTGAYFTGVFFGKHKLIPDVSPKKTVEGAIGGVFFCVLTFVVFGVIVGQISDLTPHYVRLALVGAVVSVVSMIGDLIASLIKRKYGVKDYGKIFPGHGGVMDRFDSVLATAPFLFMFADALKLLS